MFGWKRYIVLLVVMQLVLGLAYLGTVPRIHIDEAWNSSLGYNLAHTGSLKHPFVDGFGGMDVHFVQNQVVLPLVCAAIFKVVGYSIAISRIGSLLFGTLAVVSIYAVMRRWFGDKQAFWIGLATIIHPWFFEVSRRARPEIYYTALALVYLWLIVVYFDSGSRRSAFFAGVFAGLSSLAHPNGLIMVFVISCVIIVWRRGKLLGLLIPWATLGFTVTVLPYVIYVIWAVQDPRVSFTEQMQSTILRGSLLHNEIIRWKSFLQWPKGAPLAAIMLISWIMAWYRSSAAEKTIAAIIAMFVLILPFASVNWTGRYLVAVIPFFSAVIVRLVWRIVADKDIIRQNFYKIRFVVGTGIALVYLSMCTVAIGLMFYHLRGADFSRVVNRVASVVGPGSRVYGDPILWVGHDKYRYGPWRYAREHEPDTVRQVIVWASRYRFDYVVRIVAPMGIRKPPSSMPSFRMDNTYDNLCRRFGTRVDKFYDSYYGPIEIYKLKWDGYSRSRRAK